MNKWLEAKFSKLYSRLLKYIMILLLKSKIILKLGVYKLGVVFPGPRIKEKNHRVVFLNNCYYHFYYLAKALRNRGWDAITVSYEDPINGQNIKYYHGEDLNLYDPDRKKFEEKISSFYNEALKRFSVMNFYGDGTLSFFPKNYRTFIPEDILRWRLKGGLIAYTACGCNSIVRQSSVSMWSGKNGHSVCDSCKWQDISTVCSDKHNLKWGKRVFNNCDIVFGEGMPALDYLARPFAYREMLTMCLDSKVWDTDLEIPEQFLIKRKPGEVLIYHGMGNYHSRQDKERNIKGSPAIFRAVEKLKSEGFSVGLVFITDMKNIDVRFIQAQCDIIVDQLIYGRFGSTSKEGLMLGKPVICYINAHENYPHKELKCILEAPIVSATEDSIYSILKNMILNKSLRDKLSIDGRAYAIKWLSSEACAARYESILDMVFSGEFYSTREQNAIN